nr:hypothetical protein Iba_chr11eCG4560 [Ipomoea batatas]
MAMGDGISLTKPLTASCEAFFRRNLLPGILCIEMAPGESLFPANGTLLALDSLCIMALVLDLTKNQIGVLEFRRSWGWCSHTLFSTAGGDFLVGGSGSMESGEGRLPLVFPPVANYLFFLSATSVFNTYIWTFGLSYYSSFLLRIYCVEHRKGRGKGDRQDKTRKNS